ncbi:molybdopterin-dependent oxidoreductase [Lipingzhangella sp. LS1_29]|uniref:Molybdopterin-dependent oxidoreductase n=1 Tax=Lipingzhangella rawalii TaxID=2055835 RepID=A0ABU2H8V2_9ACTN|nr:molybdopterin cofactor-binding domain-containing protein [Lipingzhangella rawalii]MDS1271024.1 molybdopterin-dependent oxidoreductase [Lipingzhangella rawalii]
MDVTVNGSPVPATPETTLDQLVRDDLDLTGTKVVCGTGVCGACTVLVDATPTLSCVTPCATVDGRNITTVEGLGGDHPVQRAFAVEDALQCGYCTPGMVVAAASFVDRWRAEHGDTPPHRDEVTAALAGHLCRCGAYPGIIAAVTAACTGRYDPHRPLSPAPRTEAPAKVTGQARYTTDIRLPNQQVGVIVRSPHAHARIEGIKAPADVPLVRLRSEGATVRYVGQPVAAVAAPTDVEARRRAAEVSVQYTPLPAVLTEEQARAEDAPQVYPEGRQRKRAPLSSEAPQGPVPWTGNLRGPAGMSWRPTAAARRTAATGPDSGVLVTGSYTTSAQTHTPFEPHCCVAHWETNGTVRLYVSTQSVRRLARAVARRWELPVERVRVHSDHVGGGFGAKAGLTSDVIAAVDLARHTGTPVRVTLSRREELTDGGHRPATRIDLALATDAEGGLSGLTMDSYGSGGVSVGSNAATLARFVYGHAPRRLRDYDVLTHHPPATPFRGPGGPPMTWALEQAVDEAAYSLGVDPLDLRRRWDGNPKRQRLYDWAGRLPSWRDRPTRGSRPGRLRRGVGLACANWLYLLDPATRVELSVDDGLLVARTATQDIGTGSRTVLVNTLATELGLPSERIRVEVGDSAHTHGPAAIGSCSTPSLAPAAADAARRLRRALNTPTDAPVRLDTATAQGVSVVGRRRRDRGGYVTPFPVDGVAIGRGFAGAVLVTQVEVDTRLGTIRPLRVDCGISAGRIHAERLARNQCEGGVIQGVGYALYEQRTVDPTSGTVLSTNLDDYQIPGIADTPEIDVHFHTDGWDHVRGGGVGLGEVSTVAVAASIGNAVHNATGWRPRSTPILPEQVLHGLEEQS